MSRETPPRRSSSSRLGLRGKIIVTLLPALIPLLLIVGLTYTSVRSSAIETARNLSRLIVDNGAHEANTFLSTQRAKFQEWVREDVYGLAIEFNTTDEMYERFKEMAAAAPEFSLLVLTDKEGRILVACAGGEEARKLAQQHVAESSQLGDGTSVLLTGSKVLAAAGLPDQQTLVFGYHCKDSSGNINGALLAYLDWGQMDARVAQLHETFVGSEFPGAQACVLDVGQLQALCHSSQEQRGKKLEVGDSLRKWLTDAANAHDVATGSLDGRQYVVTFAPLRDAAQLGAAEQADLERSSIVLAAFLPEADVLTGARSALYLSLATAGVGALVLLALVWFAGTRVAKPINGIVDELRESAAHVTGASAQVSETSQTLAEGASQQASSLEETSSALEQMAAMTRTNAENAANARELAHQAREAAQSGDATMTRLNGAMGGINESSSQISKIIKVIEEIAFQTNLLALNAAVEAARAGEHGKGFAVVAEEVRNLAQRAAGAARETTDLIEESVRRAKEGSEVASDVTGALSRIVSDVGKASELVQGIAKASDEQAQGVEQVNAAVSQMDQITQSNAAGAEESASAAAELSTQAAMVDNVVEDLARLISGGGGRQPAARRGATANPASAQDRPPTAQPHDASSAKRLPKETDAGTDDAGFGDF